MYAPGDLIWSPIIHNLVLVNKFPTKRGYSKLSKLLRKFKSSMNKIILSV